MNCGTMFPTFVTRSNWTGTPVAAIVHEFGMAARPRPALAEVPVSVARLIGLLEENGEDDYGAIGPTQHAFLSAIRMVGAAELKVQGDLRSSPSVDPEGGVRVVWRHQNRQVKLICPATAASPVYIYSSSGTNNSVENQNVDVNTLANALFWMVKGDDAGSRTTR